MRIEVAPSHATITGRSIIIDPCEHFADIRNARAAGDGCASCVALGEKWTALRVCLSCGHVGCCEDSRHAHALQHYNATGHPMIASFEPGDAWGWCYPHRRYFDPMPMALPKKRSPLVAFLARAFERLRRAADRNS